MTTKKETGAYCGLDEKLADLFETLDDLEDRLYYAEPDEDTSRGEAGLEELATELTALDPEWRPLRAAYNLGR